MNVIKYWILGLLLSISSLYSIEKKTIQVKVVNDQTVDLCGNQFEKEVRFYISLGNIEAKDSLLGYSIKINYDSTVIKMKSFLKTNTLTSFFDFNDYRIVQNEGYIVCSAGQVANFFTPVFGDKPLVAFSGSFIGSCLDSTIVSVEYIDFTEEFQCKLDNANPYISTKIDAKVQNKPNRKLTIKNVTDTLYINNDSLVDVKYSINANTNNKIDIMTFDLKINSDKSNIYSVDVLQDTNITVSQLKVISKNYFQFDLKRKLNLEISKIDLVVKTKAIADTNIVLQYKLLLSKVNECACVTVFDSCIQNLKITKIVKDNIDSENEIKYYTISSNAIILNDNCNGSKIEIYDFLGRELYNGTDNYNNIINTDLFPSLVMMRIKSDSFDKKFKLKIDKYK